jgi:hypothetical protein
VTYPTAIANLQTVSASDSLAVAGHADRHNELKAALESLRTLIGDSPLDGQANIDARMDLFAKLASPVFTGTPLIAGTNEGNQTMAPEQFFYLGANGSTIANSPTNPFGVSPNLSAYGVYDFYYHLVIANSSTGAITAGWAATAFTKFNAVIEVFPTANGTTWLGVNPFQGSTTNKAITGGNTAATHILRITGTITAQNAIARFPLNVQVASGNLTPQAGSWFRFTNRGVSSSGTGNITVGNVA